MNSMNVIEHCDTNADKLHDEQRRPFRGDCVDAVTFQTEAMQHERLMYHISWSMLGNNEDCADAVQDALMRAWQKKATLKSMDKFRPWLMMILTNTCKDMLRKRKKQRFVPLEDAMAVAQQDTQKELLPLMEAIGILKPEMRVVITLYYLEGNSVEEVADILSLPTGTVKSRMSHARKKLSILLQDEWEGEE